MLGGVSYLMGGVGQHQDLVVVVVVVVIE